MDNVTHALAGALIGTAALAMADRRADRGAGSGAHAGGSPLLDTRSRTTIVVAAIIGAELPDADLLYAGASLGMGRLGYLLHHRGHTHTVLFALLSALVMWGIVLTWRRKRGASPSSGSSFAVTLLGVLLAGTLSHLALDFTNSYGVHPFWPLDNRWFYGDAVFIVEPWLMILAIPPLFTMATGNITRGVLLLLLGVLLAAAWTIGMVGVSVAASLTVGTALWWWFIRRVPAVRRSACAIAAWMVVELLFFGAAARARAYVREASGGAYRDAVLTPAIGNPLCINALVVELDGDTYRASAASVGTIPSIRGPASCARVAASKRAGTTAVQWGGSFEAEQRELQALVTSNCEIAAAMQFIRVPVWERIAGDSIRFADLRYRDGGGGFATIVTARHPATCPPHVPGWVPPRQDLLQ